MNDGQKLPPTPIYGVVQLRVKVPMDRGAMTFWW